MPIEQLNDIFGPVVGTVVALMMVPAIIALWRTNIRLQKEKDEINERWLETFIRYSADAIKFSETILKNIEEDAPDKNSFRTVVRDHISEQRSFMAEVLNSIRKS